MNIFDPLNLILIGVAGFVFWRLKSVLGTRTGLERPPVDPFARPEPPAAPKTIPLPGEKPPEVWQGHAPEGSPLAAALAGIAAKDAKFTVPWFLDGARAAYEMIVTAFAAGDRAGLEPLLSKDVLADFSAAIEARQKQGETLESKLVAIREASITEARLEGRRASLTVKFVSDFIQVTKNKAGEVLSGDAQRIQEITDLWTFERDMGARDPNWKLVATDSV